MGTDVIAPCRNEEGNIEAILSAIYSSLDENDRLIVVEGGSADKTWEKVQEFSIDKNKIRILQQQGIGKFDAVLGGIAVSENENILIWDVDGTLPLEENLKIWKHCGDKAVFVTGDRLRGQREKGAMQFINLLGNHIFGILWGIYLKQKPFDALCGTKYFPRRILNQKNPRYQELISTDPYGDFAFLWLAKSAGIEIISLPVEYKARVYGATNIQRWRGGFSLLKFMITIYRWKLIEK